MGGRSSKRSPGGVRRRGPAKLTGLARADHWGSVSTLTPSSWISSVAWPTQVTVGSAPLARSAAPSLGMRGKVTVRGLTVLAQMRRAKNAVRVQKGGRAKSGLALAKPCWRWWAGAPGTGPPTPVQAVASSRTGASRARRRRRADDALSPSLRPAAPR